MQEIRLLFDNLILLRFLRLILAFREPDETESSFVAMLFLKQTATFPQVMRHSLTTLACQLPGLEKLLEYISTLGWPQP